jgi:outer membrane lipoprotein
MTSCASTFSRRLRSEASPPIPFQELLETGEAHKGEVVILGGYVLKALNEQDGSLLTILQAPLDSRDRPKSRDLSEGRFLVRTKRFLDPEIYSKGRKLSVGGIVSEVRPQPLGKHLYQYPVIEAEELYLWPKETRYVRPYHDYWHYPWYPYPYRPYPWWFW